MLVASIHLSLVQVPSLLEQLVYYIQEVGSETQVDRVLGSWCMATQDIDRHVALQARKSYDLAIIIQKDSAAPSSSALLFDSSSLSSIVRFIRRAVYHPIDLYSELNPVQPTIVAQPPATSRKGAARQALPPVIKKKPDISQSRSKAEEDEETEDDRRGRLRVGALGAIRRMLGECNFSRHLGFFLSLFGPKSRRFQTPLQSSQTS